MNGNDAERPSRTLFEILRRRSTVTIVTFAVISIAALAFVLTHKFKYGALAHVVLVNDASGRDPSIAAVDMPTIVTGSTVLDDVRGQLGLSDSVNDLRKAVIARVAPKSSLMTIAVENHDPDSAIEIDNAIADTFARLYWNLAGSRYDEVTRRLDADVTVARRRLSALERRVEAAAAGAAYVGSQASLDAGAAHLGELTESRGVALAQFVTDRANLQADLGEPAKTAKIVRAEILKNDAAYSQAQLLVSKDIAQYTTTRASVTALFPGIAGFGDKIKQEGVALGALRARALSGTDAYSPSQAGQIVQTAKDEAAVKGDQVKLAAYDEQIRTLNRKLSRPPANAPSMGTLRAERDTAEAQLQALSLALSNAQAGSAEARSLGQVVVVDRATEARPTLLGPALLLALGIIVAFIGAIAAAYLAEWLVPRLLGPSDIEDLYDRPVLAALRAR